MILSWLEALAVHYGAAFASDTRALADDERADALEVFGTVLNLDPVRVIRTTILAGPMTLGNAIRFPIDYPLDRITLIHELAHVWQYQTRGTSYISNSLWHQGIAILTTGSRYGAYHLSWQDLKAPSIHDLPAEKQAVMVERWFANPTLRRNPDYERLLSQIQTA
jgi:hypothetical protein